MSGGGDSSGWTPPSRPKPGGGNDACDIFEITTISSPVPAIVKTLKVGDILEVSILGASQLVVVHNGEIAGSITSPKMMLFVDCIANFGNVYVARVLSINGGQVQIKVHRQ